MSISSVFSSMSIARHQPAVVLNRRSTINEAIMAMSEKGVRHAIISEDGRKVDGLLSAKAILRYIVEQIKSESEKPGENLNQAFELTAYSIANKAPITASTSTSVPDLMAIMSKNNIGILPLVDEKGELKAILSERHLLKLFEENPMFIKVADIMSSPAISLDAKSTIMDAIETMAKHDMRRIPITDEGVLHGVVTILDILKFLAVLHAEGAIAEGRHGPLFENNVMKIASLDPKCIDCGEDLSGAVRKMDSNHIGSLIVMSDGKPVGIITERDFVLKLPKLRSVAFMVNVVLMP